MRLAGYICDEHGAPIGIANTVEELRAVREELQGATANFTGPGVHDEQLTPAEFFAW